MCICRHGHRYETPMHTPLTARVWGRYPVMQNDWVCYTCTTNHYCPLVRHSPSSRPRSPFVPSTSQETSPKDLLRHTPPCAFPYSNPYHQSVRYPFHHYCSLVSYRQTDYSQWRRHTVVLLVVLHPLRCVHLHHCQFTTPSPLPLFSPSVPSPASLPLASITKVPQSSPHFHLEDRRLESFNSSSDLLFLHATQTVVPKPESPTDEAYPTPPSTPIDEPVALPISPEPESFGPRPLRNAFSLSDLKRPPVTALTGDHSAKGVPSAGLLRLESPRSSLLSVLGGVRVLRIDAVSVLDRMPYSASRSPGLTLPALAPAPASATLQAADSPLPLNDKRKVRPDLGSLRRAVSAEVPAGVSVQPPTPSRDAAPKVAKVVTPEAVTPSASPLPSAASLPVLPRTSPRSLSPANPSPQSSSRGVSPRPQQRAASAIAVQGNVLPEVRSPRRHASMENVPVIPRRQRRPRLFGFTGIDIPGSSTASSGASSPEVPASPTVEAVAPNITNALPTPIVPRRGRRPDNSVGHASSPPQNGPTLQPRSRRDTGLRLDLAGIVSNPLSTGPVSAGPGVNGVVPSTYHGVIRKKSGEVVKSALKYNGPLLPNGTPAEERKTMFAGSKSCPTTPSCPKYVHFDSKLEHVKLFLRSQKPLVVSAQGSPTDDLSEHEDNDEEEEAPKVLQMRLPNFPTVHAPDEEVFLESLFLSEERDMLRGIVQVKNLAFEKCVTVRFTFDWWQTVSEVSATYKESIRGGSNDRFQFNIKLSDLLDRIEEKTLFICIRYNASGRDIWDSNGGSNYQVLFERRAPEKARYMPKSHKMANGMGQAANRTGKAWSLTGGPDNDRMADLRAKLNRLTAEDRELNGPIPVSPSKSKRSAGGFHAPPRSPRSPTSPRWSGSGPGSELPPMSDLAGRYDIGSALKTKGSPRRGVKPLPDVRPATEFYAPRMHHFGLPPTPLPMGPNSPQQYLPPPLPNSAGSPYGATSPNPFGPSSPIAGPSSPQNGLPRSPIADTPVPLVASALGVTSAATTAALTVMSPSSSPPAQPPSLGNSSTSSLSSVGSAETPPQAPPVATHFDAADTTPSDTTDSTVSESPVSPPSDSPFSLPDRSPWSSGKAKDDTDMSMANYRTFIEQFCWGGDATQPAKRNNDVRRVHSTSDLNGYFASPPDLGTPGAFTPTYAFSQTGSNATVTPSHYRARSSPPTLADLTHVDNAIRSLSSSLSTTPIEGSPRVSPHVSPCLSPAIGPAAMTRIHSNPGVLAS